MKLLSTLFVSVICLQGQAAIPPVQSQFQKANKYIESGAIVGGLAQRDLVLSAVRRSYSKKSNIERIVVEMNDTKTDKPLQRSAYYHIDVDKKSQLVVIDLAGIAASSRPLDEVANSLKKSPYVLESQMTMDPEDRSANLILKLKPEFAPYKLEAFELKGGKQTARLVVDITGQAQVKK